MLIRTRYGRLQGDKEGELDMIFSLDGFLSTETWVVSQFYGYPRHRSKGRERILIGG